MNKTSSVLSTSIWSIVTICGLAIIIYGLLTFSIMPATGVYVALIGLIVINIGITKIQKVKSKIDGKKSVKKQGNIVRRDSKRKTYRIVGNSLYLSNFILVMFFLPDFSNTFGDNFSFIIRAFIGMITTILYTGIILSVFQKNLWVIIVGLLTWSPFFFKVLYHQ